MPLLTWASVVYSINSTAYLGLDAYKVLVSKWSWAVGYRGNGSAYVDNHVELTIRWDTWLFKPVDQGYRVKHSTTRITSAGLPNFKNIKVEGELPTEPFLLDGQGRILQSGANPVLCDGTAGAPGPFHLYKEQDLNLYFPSVLPGPFTTT